MTQFWYLMLYSFMGCGLEMGYAWLKLGSPKGRRTLLLLPMCPVYGLGAAAVLALPTWVQSSPPLLFLMGGVTAAAVEYGMGYFYERFCGVAFWDYREYAMQLHGRVCPRFTVYWGLLSVFLVYWLHPIVVRFVTLLPERAVFPFFGLFIMDNLYTVLLLRYTQKRSILSFASLNRLFSKDGEHSTNP